MASRRLFLLSSTSSLGLLVSGCDFSEPEYERPVGLPALSIDIHAHLFNATDIPILGFLNQVFIRSPESLVNVDAPIAALIRLIVSILTKTISTADKELENLPLAGVLSGTSVAALQEQDKTVVAEGVREFSQRSQNVNSLNASEDALEDAQLLLKLNQLANRGLFVSRSSQDLGSAVADAVFDEPSGATFRLRVGIGELAQTLKWAALLTRNRSDILSEWIRLFGIKVPDGGGEPKGVLALSPSLVDFEYWFVEMPQKHFSKITDQIALMSRLAKLEHRAVLLNFAPFCPLRAALENGDGHRAVRDAILNQGFVGVKLYPPMGFKPIENRANDSFGHRFKVNGTAIDRELRRMYCWCERNGVPIKAHGNNSLAAQECSGRNAAPDLWGPVLLEFPKLRVNIAHFGGFEEDYTVGKCTDTKPSYEERAANLISPDNHAYVDLGYWDEVMGRNRPGSEILTKVNELVAKNGELANRIMYGSDYTMIGRERQHGAYLADLKTAIDSLHGIDVKQIFSLNARAYLQLDDPRSQTRQRLRRFFPPGHPYFSMVGE